MSSRHLRPGSPTGRRFDNPGRASTGTVQKPYDMPSNYTTRETYTSPRSSGERVVPISKDTYVGGRLVESTRKPLSVDPEYHDKNHHRRSTYDADLRAPPSTSSSLRSPTTVHHDRDVSPGDQSAHHEDRYISSNANPRREHKKVYSIDDGRATRIPAQQEIRSRDEYNDDRNRQQPSDRSHPYHLRGSAKSSNVDDYGAYEYTDARGMFTDTEPKWRPRRGSIDTVTRDRPASMVDSYPNAPRPYNRELGPPPSRRGFDKVADKTNNSGMSRHGSLQGTYRRSPSRNRGYTTSSTYSDDENYPVAPRVSRSRDDSSYYPSDRGSDITSPTRAAPDDYHYGPRRKSRFEDREVASRGFGIRAPSVDARSSRESDVDRYPTESPLMIEAPPPAQPTRRDYPSEPREAPREDRYKELERRDQERIRDNDRDNSRAARDSPPLRERDPQRDREYVGRERERDYENPRRDRDREYRERNYERYSDEERRPRDRRLERDYYEDERREKGDRDGREEREARDYYNHPERHDHPHASGALAGAAAAGTAAYGAKEAYDKRYQGERLDDKDAKRDKRMPAEQAETRQVQSGSREGYAEDRRRDDRENEKGRRYEEDEEQESRRPRNYVSKRQEAESVQRRDGEASLSKHSEIIDPEADYLRRVKQQEQEIGRTQGKREDRNDDSDRERGRRDREGPRELDMNRDMRGISDGQSESMSDSQALSRYGSGDHEVTESPVSEDASEQSEEKKKKKRVSIVVDPPKEQKMPKSILRKPTAKFPEHPNEIREGVAPLDKAKTTGDQSIPPTARWTKINRSMVNPEALLEKGERFEERQDHVIVLRVLTKEEVQKFANRTKEIRGKCNQPARNELKRGGG